MADVVQLSSDGNPIIFCEGCKCGHKFYIQEGHPYHDASGKRLVWTWNKNIQHPTFGPSLIIDPDSPKRRCHINIDAGWITFHGDCGHDMKNKRIQLQPFESDAEYV